MSSTVKRPRQQAPTEPDEPTLRLKSCQRRPARRREPQAIEPTQPALDLERRVRVEIEPRSDDGLVGGHTISTRQGWRGAPGPFCGKGDRRDRGRWQAVTRLRP